MTSKLITQTKARFASFFQSSNEDFDNLMKNYTLTYLADDDDSKKYDVIGNSPTAAHYIGDISKKAVFDDHYNKVHPPVKVEYRSKESVYHFIKLIIHPKYQGKRPDKSSAVYIVKKPDVPFEQILGFLMFARLKENKTVHYGNIEDAESLPQVYPEFIFENCTKFDAKDIVPYLYTVHFDKISKIVPKEKSLTVARVPQRYHQSEETRAMKRFARFSGACLLFVLKDPKVKFGRFFSTRQCIEQYGYYVNRVAWRITQKYAHPRLEEPFDQFANMYGKPKRNYGDSRFPKVNSAALPEVAGI